MRAAATHSRHICRGLPIEAHLHARRRLLHTTLTQPATPLPHATVPGPPPKPPVPSATFEGDRVARKRKQANLLKLGEQLKATPNKPGTAWQKRFWKNVSVQTNDDGTFTILLDTRPVRTPAKTPLTIPANKPHLATAIALEWDSLVSAAQATKHHYIPLTSLASRALDIANADAAGDKNLREGVVDMLMGYLKTDTLLCWAPEANIHDPLPEGMDGSTRAAVSRFSAQTPSTTSPHSGSSSSSPSSTSDVTSHATLRSRQAAVATPILSYLTTHIWPGVTMNLVLEESSIRPTPQPEMTTAVIRGWCSGLGAWELAGLERASLAGKSLCVGARLVGEWSPLFGTPGAGAGGPETLGKSGASVAGDEVRLDDSTGRSDNSTTAKRMRTVDDVASSGASGSTKRFGIEEAADACTQEVQWQTQMWGEVEDTHDVDKEDVRRQLGSVILLVS